MRLLPIIGTIAAFALATAACGQASQHADASGDQIRAYIMAHPEVIEQALSKLQDKRQAEADAQVGKVLVANRSKMEQDPRDFVYGNPNGKGVPEWPAFSDKQPVVMYFGGTAHTGPVPSESALRVLDGYFAWRRSPDGAQVKAPRPFGAK